MLGTVPKAFRIVSHLTLQKSSQVNTNNIILELRRPKLER